MTQKQIIMKKILVLAISLTLLISCKKEASQAVSTSQDIATYSDNIPENAVIYEVNIRQYSPSGTFNAFTKDIPKLKEMGVKILWLMPIHPIGVKNRKEGLGSYYSVKDYRGSNPEFGNLDDYKNLVKKLVLLVYVKRI